MLTYDNWRSVYANLAAERDITADDRVGHVGPLSHASGAYLVTALLRGACNVLLDFGDPDRFLTELAAREVSMFSCVPTVLTRLVATARIPPLPRLRRIMYGAEPMPRNTLESAWERFGPILAQNYGCTEAMMTCAWLPEHDHLGPDGLRHGCIGRPYRTVNIELRDTSGRPVADGETGELTVCSPHVSHGYWQDDEATRAVLRDGWLRTGDLARRGADGLFYLNGRASDMLISGGFNIQPAEVESVLSAVPGIREVAVVGLPDDVWGERVVAVIAGDETRNRQRELRARVHPLLGFRTPKQWVWWERLPRNATGKVDRAEVRRLLLAGDTAS